MRKITNENNNWYFLKSDASLEVVHTTYPQWTTLDLPHTWNASDGARGFDYYRGVGWYVKELTVSELESHNQLFIEFQGANSVTELFVNGEAVGKHQGGYATFRFEITSQIKFGEKNILAVKVDNSEYEDVYPLRADFTFYGGIYRDVNVISVHPVHIDLEDFGSSGVYIEQKEVTQATASLNIHARVQNKTDDDQKVRLWYEVFDNEDRLVLYASQEVLVPATKAAIRTDFPLEINRPVLWDGRNNPHLYKLTLKLQQFNDTIDELTIPFGVRSFSVDPAKGFHLNGASLRLNGVSRHQDKFGKGWALAKADHAEDMALINEIGATSVRLAHYQHDAYFYDLCDQAGLVVWAEIPFITEVSKGDDPQKNAEQQLIELIRQNFNHPSICFWGIQNEIQIDHVHDQVAREIVKNLNTIAKKEDPSRLSTMANVLTVDDEDEYNYITDIIGYNKYYGWYMGKAEDFATWIDQYHQTNPHTPLSISEYGAEGIVEYHTNDPKVNDYSEEYHTLFHETVWNIFSERPFLWSTYVWNMFDFGANIRDEGGVQGRNNKGLVTFDRKTKKDAFYMYKAHWSKEPFVHITSKRFIERAESTITLAAYTNCAEAEVFVNDVSIGIYQAENKKITVENVALTAEHNYLRLKGTQEDVADQAYFHRVAEPYLAYQLQDSQAGESVGNWFVQPELDENEVMAEIKITDDVYSTRNTIEELMANELTRACVIEVLGDLQQIPMYGMMKNMKIDVLMEMDQESQTFSKARINKLNQGLTQIKKP